MTVLETSREVRDYAYQAAGAIWLVPTLRLSVFDDGEEAISLAEIERVHRAIANELCGEAGPLTFEELDFLCDVADLSLAELARTLSLHRGRLARGRDQNAVPAGVTAMAARRLFWFKIFGAQVHGKFIPLDVAGSDRSFLQFVHDQARADRLADPISRAAA